MIAFPPIITIDGPSGVGKGTLSKILSKKLRWNILDSGVIYRVLAMVALSRNISINVEHKKKLIEIAAALDITFINEFGRLGVFVEGKFMDHEIYTENIGDFASKLAVFPEVREVLLEYQRDFHRFPGLVANGRDMGTVVFPNASLKIFLDASCRVRCKRRLYQLREQGIHVNFDYLLKKIKERDYRDYTRKVSPLIPADNALIFNSTYLSLHEIVCAVLKCFYHAYMI